MSTIGVESGGIIKMRLPIQQRYHILQKSYIRMRCVCDSWEAINVPVLGSYVVLKYPIISMLLQQRLVLFIQALKFRPMENWKNLSLLLKPWNYIITLMNDFCPLSKWLAPSQSRRYLSCCYCTIGRYWSAGRNKQWHPIQFCNTMDVAFYPFCSSLTPR